LQGLLLLRVLQAIVVPDLLEKEKKWHQRVFLLGGRRHSDRAEKIHVAFFGEMCLAAFENTWHWASERVGAGSIDHVAMLYGNCAQRTQEST